MIKLLLNYIIYINIMIVMQLMQYNKIYTIFKYSTDISVHVLVRIYCIHERYSRFFPLISSYAIVIFT